MTGISKSFGGITVLDEVNFDLRPGEVHILAGENGAGKSTLMKILAGVYREYSGEIFLKGQAVRFRSPREAYDHGIAVIYQELSLVDSMSVAENLHLGRERLSGGEWIDRKGQRATADTMLRATGLDLDSAREVEHYPISSRQMVEIARALSRNADAVVMDEPTSALNEVEVERLFGLIRAITQRGCGVIYITHKLEEIFKIGERITVLRDGRNVWTSPMSEVTRDSLITSMVGREVETRFPYLATAPGEILVHVEGLRVAGESLATRPDVENVSFTLHAGEVVGLAGLRGSGNSEVLQALFGANHERVSGRIEFTGRKIERGGPRESIDRQIVLLTNDRKGNGLVMELPIRENITLPSLRRFSKGGWIRRRAEDRIAKAQASALRIRAASVTQEVGTLSGGNQQKVVFAKWLETRPRVLLLDDPTRGVDVGAKQEIYELIMRLKGEGCAMLLVSSETPELLGLCDRILVMSEGRIVREFARSEATQEGLLHAALGLPRVGDA
jgi:ABC-type sugar transport system ATPase subunit